MNKKIKETIMSQIENAFKVKPDLARLYHGQRKIAQGQRGKSTSVFPSRKCKGAIPLESRLELAHALCLEGNETVLDYRTQALRIPLTLNNFSFPDFLIRLRSGLFEVHEIKPSIENLSESEINRFELAGKILVDLNIEFKVIDVKGLPNERTVEKLRHLYSRGHVRYWTERQVVMAMEVLLSKEIFSVKFACDVLEQNDLPSQLVEYLLFHKKIFLLSSTHKSI